MKIDADTINVLKSFSKINLSIVVPVGNMLTTNSPTKTIKATAKVKTDFTHRFAIYNLDRFIAIISTFNEPELTFSETSVQISDGNKKIDYVYADETTLKMSNKSVTLPSQDVSCTLTNENLKDVEKAAGILALPEIVVSGDGTDLFLQAMDTKGFTKDVYSIKIGQTDKVFRAVFKAENFKLLPKTYQVTLSSAGIAQFVSDDVEYFITMEEKVTKF